MAVLWRKMELRVIRGGAGDDVMTIKSNVRTALARLLSAKVQFLVYT